MKKLSLLLILTCVFVSLPARAQQFSFDLGAQFDASALQHKAGVFSIGVTNNGGADLSYTTFLIRSSNKQYITSVLSGYQHRFQVQGKLELDTDIQGGVATSQSATTGAGLFGGAVFYHLRPHVDIGVSGHALISPNGDGNISPQVQAVVRFTP